MNKNFCPANFAFCPQNALFAQTPSFFAQRSTYVLGRVPLMPLFLRRNSIQTIPHCFRNLQRCEFRADVSKESGRKGSNVYEVNQWLLLFGRGKPRLGDLSVSDSEELRMAVMQEGTRRGHATRTNRRHDAWRQQQSEARNEIAWADKIGYVIRKSFQELIWKL